MPGSVQTNSSYSKWIGFVFVFNLIVGTGALTLPAVFAKAGWFLSLIALIVISLMSFMTVTFIIEALACTHAIKNWQKLQVLTKNQNVDGIIETDDELDLRDRQRISLEFYNEHSDRMPLNANPSSLYYYQLNEKYELGEMASLFFDNFGRIIFYLCFSIYLYGDLSIYSAAVAKSLRDLLCEESNSTITKVIHNGIVELENSTNVTCWRQHVITRQQVYRIILIGFTMTFGPLAIFSVQKTKYLQMLTGCFRFLAFSFMFGLAIQSLVVNGAKGHPSVFNLYNTPALFGASIYSFMCHHSVPGLLAPIRDKLSVRGIITYDYIVICLFYIALSMSGIFAFSDIKDLYTLNFMPKQMPDNTVASHILIGIEYFLALFPIITLSTSYPIVAITLRSNLQALFLDMSRFNEYNFFMRHLLFPVCAICPPFVITYFTDSLTSLVAFTGSYAGSAIQYLVPVSLIYYARRTCSDLLGNGMVNHYESPFRSNFWLLFVILWTVFCVAMVTINFLL